MRLRPLHTLLLSFTLTPGCGSGPVDEPEPDAPPEVERPRTEAAPGELDAPAEVTAAPAAPTADEGSTLAWPMVAWRIELDADRADALAPSGDGLAFAGRAGEVARLARFVPPPHAPAAKGTGAAATATPPAPAPQGGALTLAATLDAGPIGADPATLVPETRGRPALAAWHDPDGAIWTVAIDEALAGATPQKLREPADGRTFGPIALAPTDDGTLACAGAVGGPLACATLDPRGRSEGFAPIGKTPDLMAEALVPSPGGYLLLASSCRPKKSDTCKRKDLVVVRLGDDGLPPRRRPTLPLPEVEAQRGGLVVLPSPTGFILVARRVGAGDATAWKVSDTEVRELDGRFSHVVGGLDGDDGFVLVEQGPLTMVDGHPVALHRARGLPTGAGKDKRGELFAWPAAVRALMPVTVDQRVISGEGLVAFVEPIRKKHVRAAVIRLGGAGG